MAKELPYFKFEPSEWQNGNIQMCSELTQLYFINICCTYWSKLGNITERFALIKCFNNNRELFDELIDNNIVKISNGNVVISFLDSQLGEFKTKSKLSSESGRKGGQTNGVRPEIERMVGNQLYLLECWNNDERFYKMGVTSSSISRRYSGKIQYQYKVVFQIFTDKFIEAENHLCEVLRSYEYKPLLNFAGQKECYLYSESQHIEEQINNYFDFAKASLLRTDAIREDKSKEDKSKENEIKEKKIIFPFKKKLLELVNNEILIDDYIQLRKTKKATLSETFFNSLILECKENNYPLEKALTICIEKNWVGFKYTWVKNVESQNKDKTDGKQSTTKRNPDFKLLSAIETFTGKTE